MDSTKKSHHEQESLREEQLVRPGAPMSDEEITRFMRTRTRRSFLVGGVAAVAGLFALKPLFMGETDGGLAKPIRRILEFNEKIGEGYFSNGNLAPTFALERAAKIPRINGDLGLQQAVDAASWRLNLAGLNEANFPGGTASLSLQDLQQFPHVEMVTQLNCIEGWTEIVHWGGIRFADFMRKYAPAGTALPPYVSMETPDKGYYIGLDMQTAQHPQTLLCTEMNGKPLAPEHGAPLRLVTPTKYGVKNIKRIGAIRFTSIRPADYWAQQGYDWYAGL